MTENQIESMFQQLLGLGCRPPKQLSTPQGLRFAVQTWAGVLADVDPQDMARAVTRYARSSSSVWWPTPGALLSLIEDAQRPAFDNADEMWGTVVAAVGFRGRFRPPTEQDPIHGHASVNAKILAGIEACGGWRVLCISTHSEMVANRAAFRSAYEAKQQAMETRRQLEATERLLQGSARGAIADTRNT